MATRRKFGTLSRNCPRSQIWRPQGHQSLLENIPETFPIFPCCEFDQVAMLLTESHLFPWPWLLCLFCPTKSPKHETIATSFSSKHYIPNLLNRQIELWPYCCHWVTHISDIFCPQCSQYKRRPSLSLFLEPNYMIAVIHAGISVLIIAFLFGVFQDSSHQTSAEVALWFMN